LLDRARARPSEATRVEHAAYYDCIDRCAIPSMPPPAEPAFKNHVNDAENFLRFLREFG
jgi:hypothetical protein